MVISSGQFPSLMRNQMNDAAGSAVKMTMSAVDEAAMEAFHLKFFRKGGKLSALSYTEQDYEPGPGMAHWPEQTAIPEQTFYEGYPLKVTSNHFAGKFIYSYITHKAGKPELLNSGPKLLGQSEVRTREQLTHALLIWGATALASIDKWDGVPLVNPICGDGQPLFSASHRWRSDDAILNSNLLSSYYHPTQTGVFQVNKQIGRWRDPQGDAMMVRVRQLLVPIEMELVCQVFAKSQKDPLSSNNAENMFNTLVPDGYIANPRLPSVSDWFFLTNKKDYRPQIRELIPPETFMIPFSTETMASGVTMVTSYAVGVGGPAGWLGIGKVTGTPPDITGSLT